MQVTENGVRLLDGAVEIQRASVEGKVLWASVADPHVVCLIEGGTVFVFTLVTSRFAAPSMTLTRVQPSKRGKLQTLSAYCDVSGLFTTDFPEHSIKRKITKTDAEIKK